MNNNNNKQQKPATNTSNKSSTTAYNKIGGVLGFLLCAFVVLFTFFFTLSLTLSMELCFLSFSYFLCLNCSLFSFLRKFLERERAREYQNNWPTIGQLPPDVPLSCSLTFVRSHSLSPNTIGSNKKHTESYPNKTSIFPFFRNRRIAQWGHFPIMRMCYRYVYFFLVVVVLNKNNK